MPSCLSTLNGTFRKERGNAPYYGFPELKYIPHLREVLRDLKSFMIVIIDVDPR